MSLSVNITRDDFTPLLQRVKNEAAFGGLSLVMGRAAGKLVKDWLYDLNGERHRYGRNYYAQAADSVTVNNINGAVIISVTQIGFRLRRFGGRVLPKKKYLTIPDENAPEAFGRRAGEFSDLDFQIVLDANGHLRPALVRRASTALKFTRRRRKDGTVSVNVRPGELREGKVMYWLVRQTTHLADASVLPPDGLIVGTAVQAGLRRIERLKQRGDTALDPSSN
jgi:hypothetical protein